MLLPARRCGWWLLPGSYAPRRRTPLRPVCSACHEQSSGRTGSRWATACDGIGSRPCPSPPSRHLCTTPPWVWVGPLPYSSGWLVHLWIRSGRRDAPRCAVGNPPAANEILNKEIKKFSVLRFILLDKLMVWILFIHVSGFCVQQDKWIWYFMTQCWRLD